MVLLRSATPLYGIGVENYLKLTGILSNKEITWYLPRDDVKSVELVFKEDTYMIGTDLKIFYSSTSTTTGPTTAPTTAPPTSEPTAQPSNVPLVWYGEEDVATLENVGGGEFGAQNTGIENLFDDDFSTFFVSHWDNNDNPEKHLLVTFNVSLATREMNPWFDYLILIYFSRIQLILKLWLSIKKPVWSMSRHQIISEYLIS